MHMPFIAVDIQLSFTIILSFCTQHTEPPSATITPPSITVNEGEAVSIVCEAEGSGLLTVTWTMSDGSPLPMGVQENGNTLVIASAASTHLGTYVCSVRNLAGTDEDEVTLTVFCECFRIICDLILILISFYSSSL